MISLQSSEKSILAVTTAVVKSMSESMSFPNTVSGNWIVIVYPIGNHGDSFLFRSL